jgi:hypothetical protein
MAVKNLSANVGRNKFRLTLFDSPFSCGQIPVPSQSPSKKTESRLGKPIRLYPGRGTGRWLLLFLAALSTLAGLGVLAYGLWRVGLRLMDFGPAQAGEGFLWLSLLAFAVLAAGVALGLAAIRRKAKTLAIHQNGFVLREQERVHAWRWEEVDAITGRVVRNYLVGVHAGTRHHYVLGRADGSEVILDDSIRHVGQAVRFIQQETFRERFGRVVRRVEAGESVAFGPFLLARDGFRIGDSVYNWPDLHGVEMRHGKLFIRSITKVTLPADAIPNLDVLVTILLQNVKS